MHHNLGLNREKVMLLDLEEPRVEGGADTLVVITKFSISISKFVRIIDQRSFPLYLHVFIVYTF